MSVDQPSAYFVPAHHSLLIEVVGTDAVKVLNNLSTNNIAAMEIGSSLETFITDVRGWVVAHGIVVRQPDRMWLLGIHPEGGRVAAHIDRYIIREDAQVVDHSQDLRLLWLTGNDASRLQDFTSVPIPDLLVNATLAFASSTAVDELGSRGDIATMSDEEWNRRRISCFWPVMGADILDKCIPQEVDRTVQAISFTKGCYLGQETIARLDARGQLQKKLCLLEFDGAVELPATVQAGEKEVGTLTSATFDATAGRTLALGYLRRGHFEPKQAVFCGQVTGLVLGR